MLKKVLNSMNHSHIPLLKFYPEQRWPHRENGGYWGAKWEEGPGDQLTRADTASPGAGEETTAPLHHFTPLSSSSSFPHSLAGGLGTTNSLFTTERKKSALQGQSVMEGLPEQRGGMEAVTEALLFFSRWPNAGKEWGLVLHCSPSAPHPILPN